LVDLSTVAGNKISNPPWVKFQSAGWVNFPSAPTIQDAVAEYLAAGGVITNIPAGASSNQPVTFNSRITGAG
ncbi:hypothetical protein Q2452_25835, partial [Escherichia coli]|nr:hypothetical protein [Escherichia coli]